MESAHVMHIWALKKNEMPELESGPWLNSNTKAFAFSAKYTCAVRCSNQTLTLCRLPAGNGSWTKTKANWFGGPAPERRKIVSAIFKERRYTET